mgnify:CR=1 FL=1
MVTYIGYFEQTESWIALRDQKIMAGEWEPSLIPDPDLQVKVREFPGFLDSIGVNLVASYVPVGQPLNETPGVMIIETDDPGNLQKIEFYYMPYLTYSFSLYQLVPRPV